MPLEQKCRLLNFPELSICHIPCISQQPLSRCFFYVIFSHILTNLNTWLSKPLAVYMKMSCFHFATCFPALRGLLSRLSCCMVHVGKMEGVLGSKVWMENNWSIERVSGPEKRRRAHLCDPFKNEVNNLGHLGRCPTGSSHDPCEGNIMNVILREKRAEGKTV